MSKIPFRDEKIDPKLFYSNLAFNLPLIADARNRKLSFKTRQLADETAALIERKIQGCAYIVTQCLQKQSMVVEVSSILRNH
jgi:hypothetical protein